MALRTSFPVAGDHISDHLALHRAHNATVHAADYGATGDGSTDDTAAIQAAIDAASAAGGGTVVLGVGTYQISDRLELPWRVWLAGAGLMATRLRAASEMAGAMVRLYDGHGHSGIEALRLDGNDLAAIGVEMALTSYIHLRLVRVTGCNDYGLHLHGGVWINTFDRCQFVSNNGDGAYLDATEGQININTFRDCVLASNGGAGARLYGGTAQRFETCILEFNPGGGIVQTNGGINLAVERCYMERNGTTDAPNANIIIGEDESELLHNDPQIIGNYLYGGKDDAVAAPGECDHAIRIAKARRGLVQGNFTWGNIVGPTDYGDGVAPAEVANSWNEQA